MILAGTSGALMLSSYTATALYRWSAMALESDNEELCEELRERLTSFVLLHCPFISLHYGGLGPVLTSPCPYSFSFPRSYHLRQPKLWLRDSFRPLASIWVVEGVRTYSVCCSKTP